MTDTTDIDYEASREKGEELLKLLHSINPNQMEQFESVFTALIEHHLGAAPKDNLFEYGDKGYTDKMVSMAFQLWLNAKMNHMMDMERRAEEIREAISDALKESPSSKVH